MPDSFETFIAQRDLPCPGCRYNLRGLQGHTCPECGAHVDFGAFRRLAERAGSRRFRAGRGGAAIALAVGTTMLIHEAPRTSRVGSPTETAAVIAGGTFGLLIALAWLATAHRTAHKPLAIQGRIASAIWACNLIIILVALSVR